MPPEAMVYVLIGGVWFRFSQASLYGRDFQQQLLGPVVVMFTTRLIASTPRTREVFDNAEPHDG